MRNKQHLTNTSNLHALAVPVDLQVQRHTTLSSDLFLESCKSCFAHNSCTPSRAHAHLPAEDTVHSHPHTQVTVTVHSSRFDWLEASPADCSQGAEPTTPAPASPARKTGAGNATLIISHSTPTCRCTPCLVSNTTMSRPAKPSCVLGRGVLLDGGQAASKKGIPYCTPCMQA